MVSLRSRLSSVTLSISGVLAVALLVVACTGNAPSSTPSSSAPATATTIENLGCGFSSPDLARWMGWQTVEVPARRERGQCSFTTDDRIELTVRIGPAAWFPDRLTELANSSTYLSEFDPHADHQFMELVGPGPVTAVGANNGSVVIVDVEPSATSEILPGSLTRFALDWLQPEDQTARVERLGSLVASDVQCGTTFEAFDLTGTAGLSVSIPLAQLDPTNVDSGAIDVTDHRVGAVIFGQRLDINRCTDTPVNDGPVFEATWPIIAGSVAWTTTRLAPNTSQCGLTATITTHGLVAEQPGDNTITIPDLTITNDRYTDLGIDGCLQLPPP
jgi:hypothetical protein